MVSATKEHDVIDRMPWGASSVPRDGEPRDRGLCLWVAFTPTPWLHLPGVFLWLILMTTGG